MILASEITDHSAALRCHTDWRRFVSENIDLLTDGWIDDRYSKYGAEAAAPSLVAYRKMVEDTVSADTCWMSHEMMDLCQHAMEGFDTTEPFTADDAFIPHGFLVLPEPWYSLDIHGRRICHRAMLWRVVEEGVRLLEDVPGEDGHVTYTFDLNADGVGTWPVIRITTLSHIDDEDDYTEDHASMIAMCRANGWAWGVTHTTTIPLPLISSASDIRGEGDADGSWLLLWRVAQKLMAETIVTSERRPASRAVRREAQRFGYDPGAPRVIELRRPRKESSDPEGSVRSVEWTHRWIVRGHWRQQPYPTLGITKQIWIGAYEKGPDDLPLVIRERVWNWDR